MSAASLHLVAVVDSSHLSVAKIPQDFVQYHDGKCIVRANFLPHMLIHSMHKSFEPVTAGRTVCNKDLCCALCQNGNPSLMLQQSMVNVGVDAS